jgi:anti-anti-sigma regulatory factor
MSGTMSIFFKTTQRDDTADILARGSLTVENCEEIKRRLVEALDRSDHVTVSVAEDAEVDITFLQILCAADHFALKLNKSFALNGCPKALSRVIEDAGYPRFK